MKSLLTPIFAATLLLSPSALAESTPLEDSMSEIKSVNKLIRRAAGDGVDGGEVDTAAVIEAARTGQKELLKGLKYEPKMFADIPAGAVKDKAAATYRKLMAQNYLYFCEVELAAMENDWKAVEEIVKKMRALKKESHKQFIKDE